MIGGWTGCKQSGKTGGREEEGNSYKIGKFKRV